MKRDGFSGAESARLPQGFKAAGVHCGIKSDGVLDMAMLVSDVSAVAAGTFTSNRCAAAPVKLSRRHLSGGEGRAIVVNSGVANAATGEDGERDAVAMAEGVAKGLGMDAESVFVCSTGSIGSRLPMDKIELGISDLCQSCSADGGERAAEAIMTTDTRPKRWTVEIDLDGTPVRVTGVAKGAGMIEPNMATMLAFIMTDAAVEPQALQILLGKMVGKTFNRITVDGDMSTNDTVLMLANGMAGNDPLQEGCAGWKLFGDAVYEVLSRLAWMIVEDGEGATKVAVISVKGAADGIQAERAARAVANSFLVKTAWAGDNPAVGRVVDTLGYSGAEFDPEVLSIRYGDLDALSGGVCGSASQEDLRAYVGQSELEIEIDLDNGEESATVYTCNITEEYVRINM